jgi:nucleotide-binding universal stress UspA family protein
MTAKHILVPTDFSEYANYALDYAIEWARSYLSGQGSNSAKCEVAIPFNRFQRPAL